MLYDLSDPKAMLANAKHHDKLLNEHIAAWIEGSYGALESCVNEENTHYATYLVLSKEPDLDKFGLLLSDCLHNLRCALDHLIFRVAFGHNPDLSKVIENKLQFPIADTELYFNKAIQARKLSFLPENVRSLLKAFQPFSRPHSTHAPLLAILRDLNNSAKHKILAPVLSMPRKLQFEVHSIDPMNPAQGQDYIGPVKNRQVVLSFTFQRPSPEFNYDVNLHYVFATPHLNDKHNQKFETETTVLTRMLIAEVEAVITGFERGGLELFN